MQLYFCLAVLYYVSRNEPEVIHWEVAYPWPMSNRDVSFSVHTINDTVIISAYVP